MAGPEDETKRLQQRGDTRQMPIGERIALIEADAYYTRKGVEEMHADLKQHMRDEKRDSEAQNERIGKLEEGHAETRAHFRWLFKGFAAVQALVVAWIGSK